MFWRSWTLWLLGYPEAALADAEQEVKYAREISQAGTLMPALNVASLTCFYSGKYASATALMEELVALADDKGAALWRTWPILNQGCVLASIGKASEAVHKITSALVTYRSTGTTMWMPFYLSQLASAHAKLGQFEEAQHIIDEAKTTLEKTEERWWEPDVHRVTGEIALSAPEPDAAKAQAYSSVRSRSRASSRQSL